MLVVVRFLFPFLLGGGILYWMYRELPLSTISDTMLHKMRWEWMFLSFIPGIFAQIFRALRWKQSLSPLQEYPRTSSCINAIFISYAVSLVIPRIGEVMRCGILKNHDGTSFSKSLGTVVTERIVDSVLILLLTSITLIYQLPVILQFFDITGIGFIEFFQQFTTTGIIVTIICLLCMVALVIIALHKLAMGNKIKTVLQDICSGIISMKKVKNLPLYFLYSIGIWFSYFLHYYLTFYCFGFSEDLGLAVGWVSFCIGSIAVIVPTPNGAGFWHFAIKTILVLYGMQQTDAVVFALIVHSVQTLLLILLGVYGLLSLQCHRKIYRKEASR